VHAPILNSTAAKIKEEVCGLLWMLWQKYWRPAATTSNCPAHEDQKLIGNGHSPNMPQVPGFAILIADARTQPFPAGQMLDQIAHQPKIS
jgi:hypothetical protein